MSNINLSFSVLTGIKTEEDLKSIKVEGNYYLPYPRQKKDESGDPLEEEDDCYSGNDCDENYEILEGEEVLELVKQMKQAPYVTPFLNENTLSAEIFFKESDEGEVSPLDVVDLKDQDDNGAYINWSHHWPAVGLAYANCTDHHKVLLDPATDKPDDNYLLRSFFVLGSGAESDLLNNGKLIGAEHALERQLKFESKMTLIHCKSCKKPYSREEHQDNYGSRFYPSIVSSYGIPCGPDSSPAEIERSRDWTVLNAQYFADQVKEGRLEDAEPMFMLYGETPYDYVACLKSILEYIDGIEHLYPTSEKFYAFPFMWIGLGGFDIEKPLEYLRLVETVMAITPIIRDRKQILGLFIQGLSSIAAWAAISHHVRANADDQEIYFNFDGGFTRRRQGIFFLGSKLFDGKKDTRHESALAIVQYRDYEYYRSGRSFDPFSIVKKT